MVNSLLTFLFQEAAPELYEAECHYVIPPSTMCWLSSSLLQLCRGLTYPSIQNDDREMVNLYSNFNIVLLHLSTLINLLRVSVLAVS